ncbi:helix-turn-helix transcriptional regulator [Hyalangium versicolor]|uniref:helix-turn-helix transcriptional regulator n=1 Tax=Hyalangium versicolor TaxID=2861190 RepID=UPI001CCFAC3E|nr:WYL domain-containing transcriptional regulator [Hyalangium versicolor]
MTQQSIKTTLVRQWRLMELVRSSPEGLSMKDLRKTLKASEATIERDLEILKEAGLPFTKTTNTDDPIILFSQNIPSLPIASTNTDSNQIPPVHSQPDTPAPGTRKKSKNERIISTLDIPSTLIIIDRAIDEETVLHISYILPGTTGTVSSVFVPYCIHTINKCHYLFAWNTESPNYCLIEAARITQMQQGKIHTEGGFPYDGDQILSNLVETDIGELITVSVMMAPWTTLLARIYPLSVTQTVDPLPDGRNIVRCQNVSSIEALRWVLSWGSDAEILEPRSLRESLVAILRNSLASTLQKKIDELKAERDSLSLELVESN